MVSKAQLAKARYSGASLAALMIACAVPQAAFAQVAAETQESAEAREAREAREAAEAAAPAEAGAEQIIVTGSRIATGFNAPTPVTVTGADDLQAAAPRNLAEGLAQLPVFSGSTLSTNNGTATGAAGGQSLLNLRGLGANRNLILLDGRRLPPTNVTGSVDVNLIPQSLVQRVEVVTGGASAAYGSDAVAGVVNFLLDTTYEGVKGELQQSISARGDLPSLSGSITAGQSFAGGRLRVVGAVEFSEQEGLDANDPTGRQWYEVAAGRIPNPVAGAFPRFIRVNDIRRSNASDGGLITSGPLAGREFLPGGAIAPFQFGSPVGTAFMGGGGGPRANIAFSPDQARRGAFVHAEFDVTDNLEFFAEGQYQTSNTNSGNAVQVAQGAGTQFRIFRENAFLSPAVVAALGTGTAGASFTLGRSLPEFPFRTIGTDLKLMRGATGLSGALGSLEWDISAGYGKVSQELGDYNLTINRRLYAAADAVFDPATPGKIVCRSTLSGFDPGCVPLNLFGFGAPSQAAIDWITGDSVKWVDLTQLVVQANVSGDFGEGLALTSDPISFATGLEYREETAEQTSDPISQSVTEFTGVRGFPASQNNRPGGFGFSNPLPLSGAYSVKEGYVELGIPVLRDLPFARSLDVNLAARHAIYSLSGGVTTWKYGLSYEPFDDLRLRYTKSRDIRGPNILELFNSATQTSNNQVYFGRTLPALLITSGNPNLEPEEATTETYGFVYRPGFLPGFSLSVDYYSIELEGAIGNINNVIQRCEQGSALACGLIELTPFDTLIIRQQQVNLALVEVAGYDFEAAYSLPLADGRLSLRLLGNHGTVDQTTNFPGELPTNALGGDGSPKWRATLQARYNSDRWSAFVQQRYIHDALIQVDEVEGVDVLENDIPAYWYTSIGASYNIDDLGGNSEVFFSINNLFDKDPPVAVGNPTTYAQPTSNAYDRIGRYFTVGVRFDF